jgi:hypothetical protein
MYYPIWVHNHLMEKKCSFQKPFQNDEVIFKTSIIKSLCFFRPKSFQTMLRKSMTLFCSFLPPFTNSCTQFIFPIYLLKTRKQHIHWNLFIYLFLYHAYCIIFSLIYIFNIHLFNCTHHLLQSFFGSNLWCTTSYNPPYDDLAKFGFFF